MTDSQESYTGGVDSYRCCVLTPQVLLQSSRGTFSIPSFRSTIDEWNHFSLVLCPSLMQLLNVNSDHFLDLISSSSTWKKSVGSNFYFMNPPVSRMSNPMDYSSLLRNEGVIFQLPCDHSRFTFQSTVDNGVKRTEIK